MWRKSTHSGSNGGQCVEVAVVGGVVGVRDSKEPEGTVLEFTRRAWEMSVAGVRGGGLGSGRGC
jgi:hypothetical protein